MNRVPAPKFWFFWEHFVLVPSRTFCSDSFGNILLWFLRGHSDSGMGRNSDVHIRDFLGLETSIRRLMFYYVLSDLVCNSPILSSNTIYTRILIIRLFDLFLCVHYICIRYLLSIVPTFNLTLQMRRGVDFRTAMSVYEHFDAVVFWLRVLYSF